jgi:hypothetical protein
MPHNAAMENRAGEKEVVTQTPRQLRRMQDVATNRMIALSTPVRAR